MQEELQRTKQYLAEVIDECVFVERQRDLTERKLGAHISALRGGCECLVKALDALCIYTTMMEEKVIAPAMGSLLTALSQNEFLYASRNGAVDAISATAAAGVCVPSQASLNTVADVKLPDAMQIATNEAVLFVKSVRAQKLELQVQLDAVQALISSLCDGPLASSPDTCMREIVLTGQDEIVGDHPSGVLGTSPSGSVQRSAFSQRLDSRLRAYEMTVNALNSEITVLQSRFAELTDTHSRETEILRNKRAGESERYRTQLEESDAVLGRIAQELEQLINENTQLKDRLRRQKKEGN